MNRTFRSIGVNALLIVAAILTAFPLLWMLSVSFMQTGAASNYPPPLLPANPTIDNYRALFANRVGPGQYYRLPDGVWRQRNGNEPVPRPSHCG